MPRKLIVGAEVVALGGVVVDHVEDHLDTGLVERPHHRLELGDRAAGVLGGRVLVVRGEEAEGVVAPVVSQTQIEQPVVVQELVHRHQLDGGDVERLEVVDDRPGGRDRRRCRAAPRGRRDGSAVMPLTWAS